HAVAHLQQALGNFRFTKAHAEGPDGFVFEYSSDDGQRVLVAWKPELPEATLKVPLQGARIAKAERTPLKAGAPEELEVQVVDGHAMVPASETPVFLWVS